MRPSNKQRSRNKPSSNGHSNQRRSMGNIINRVFESAGPDGKVRGTPQQIIDKYQALARDAQVSGDRVAAENYLQHSEHYSRLLGEAQRQQQESRFSGPDRDEGGRGDDQPELPRPQPQAPAPAVAGLTTIDTVDSEDFGGPIDTPENRRAPFEARPRVDARPPVDTRPTVEERPTGEERPPVDAAPPVAEAPNSNGPGRFAAPEPQQQAEAAPEAPKRGRPRRRPKPEGETPAGTAQAE